MSPEIYTLIGITITILIAIFVSHRALRADLKTDIQKLDTDIQKLDTKVEKLRTDQQALNERMAGLEGLVTGLKEAIVARAVA